MIESSELENGNSADINKNQMGDYLEILKKAPEECQECTRRHFVGCFGCPNKKYWDNLSNLKRTST